MSENNQEVEISISREKYSILLREVLESKYNQPLDSNALWRDSCIADEILGIEYKDSSLPRDTSKYNTSIYHFKLKNPKRWLMVKLKYAHLNI